MQIEEIIDFIVADLSMSCSLPSILPIIEIKRLITKVALPWFYENYQYAVIKGYYYVPIKTLQMEEFTQYQYITLPCEIQNVIWVYQITDRSLFSLGFGVGDGHGNISVNNGITSQPYLNSYITTIGELGVYKTIIDGFSDMLGQLSKHTLKYDYNFGAKRLHILSPPDRDLVLETYTQIPAEDLFEMDKFRRYSLALSKQQLGRLLTRYNFNLPGGVQINGEAIRTEGEQELEKIREEIKGQSPNSFFFMLSK